jgi:hypothetical protein
MLALAQSCPYRLAGDKDRVHSGRNDHTRRTRVASELMGSESRQYQLSVGRMRIDTPRIYVIFKPSSSKLIRCDDTFLFGVRNAGPTWRCILPFLRC